MRNIPCFAQKKKKVGSAEQQSRLNHRKNIFCASFIFKIHSFYARLTYANERAKKGIFAGGLKLDILPLTLATSVGFPCNASREENRQSLE